MSAPGRDGLVAVVAPLPEELAEIRRRAGAAPTAAEPCAVVLGAVGGHDVALTVTGAGRAAADVVGGLLRGGGVSLLVGVGVAGGLSPGLAAGELVVGREVRDGRSVLPAPAKWLERASRAGIGAAATVVASDRILSTAAEKERLWRACGAPRPAVVDLESGVYAAAAAAAGVPFLVLRVVSDPAEENLPLHFSRFLRADGSVDRRRIVLAAALRPRRLAKLARLGRRVEGAARTLAEALGTLLMAAGPQNR